MKKLMQLAPRLRSLLNPRLAAVLVLLIAVALVKHFLTETYPERVEGNIRPIDGDSFRIGDAEVRLMGIDAPEGRQTCTRGGATWNCGEEARRELQRLIGRDRVLCKVADRDQHGRLLAYCTAANRDLNRRMVESGYALSYGGYLREEGTAKAAKRGLWSGEFTRPRQWRREHGAGQHRPGG